MDSVKPSFTTFDNTPHYLMELSQEEHLLLKKSTIHVGGLTFETCKEGNQKTIHTTFESVLYGDNLHTMKENNIKKIVLSRMKQRMVMITMDKSECDKSFKNVCIVNTKFDMKRKKNKLKLFNPSGIVVLMIAMEKTKTKNEENKLKWGTLIIEICERCKNNVILSNMVNHHGSEGCIYSFGNQGIF